MNPCSKSQRYKRAGLISVKTYVLATSKSIKAKFFSLRGILGYALERAN